MKPAVPVVAKTHLGRSALRDATNTSTVSAGGKLNKAPDERIEELLLAKKEDVQLKVSIPLFVLICCNAYHVERLFSNDGDEAGTAQYGYPKGGYDTLC